MSFPKESEPTMEPVPKTEIYKKQRALGLKHTFGTVYHPQLQGVVERANGILKTK